jgi:nickel-dependent lactate racemase
MAQTVEIAFGNQSWQLTDLESVRQLTSSSGVDTAGASSSRDEALLAMYEQALGNPVGFPPLDQAIVPGDTVVLAIDGSLPELEASATAITKWLTQRGLRAENLTCLLSDASETTRASVEQAMQAAGSEVSVALHNPDDQEHLAYLAAADSADPIYMNRLMVEADVVIPVSCARLNGSLDGLGCYSMYPLISDRATLGRFHSLKKLQADSQRGKMREVCDKAAWWLGILASVQVIPSVGGQVAEVICGVSGEIEASVQASMESIWQSQLDRSEAAVAVVTLGGDAGQHSWLNVARALSAVQPLVQLRGTIVVCSEVNTPLGKSLRRLSTVGAEPEQVEKKLSQDNADDTLAAQVILAALRDYEVFMTSRLKAESIESLGVGSVQDAKQLRNLIGNQDCVVVHGGEHFSVGLPVV